MSRTLPRIVSASLVMAVAVAWLWSPVSGQGAGQPSTSKGEWPHYTADLKGSRYSPLDQIDATNFSKLSVAWRFKTDNLGPRPENKLEGTPIMVNGMIYTTARRSNASASAIRRRPARAAALD